MRLAAANPNATTMSISLYVTQKGSETSWKSAETPGISPAKTPPQDGKKSPLSPLLAHFVIHDLNLPRRVLGLTHRYDELKSSDNKRD
jgi:Golgi nucleoside diphosphatase